MWHYVILSDSLVWLKTMFKVTFLQNLQFFSVNICFFQLLWILYDEYIYRMYRVLFIYYSEFASYIWIISHTQNVI